MKPTISSQPHTQPNIPLTHYNYQSPLEASRASATTNRETTKLGGFWKLSTNYISGGEATLNYASEAVLFAVITSLSACQIFWMLVAAVRCLRGY